MNMDNAIFIQLYFLLSIFTSFTVFLLGMYIYNRNEVIIRGKVCNLFSSFKIKVNIPIEDCISFEKYRIWRYSSLY